MAPPRILIADDDPWILRMVATVLEKRGYVVEGAHDGEEAYGKALENPPDLIICDVMMPKMDGWDLIRALRSRPEFAFVPFIFLTALSTDNDRIQGFRLGADDYVTKPFRFEELDLRVSKTLKRSQVAERQAREHLGLPEAERPARRLPTAEVAPSTGLAGRLAEVGIPALLTLLEMERKSGILVVARTAAPAGVAEAAPTPDQVARIFLHQGKIYSAAIDGQDEPANAECIYQLLEWQSGQFEFDACEIEMDDAIGQSTSFLLMEGARRMDERNAE